MRNRLNVEKMRWGKEAARAARGSQPAGPICDNQVRPDCRSRHIYDKEAYACGVTGLKFFARLRYPDDTRLDVP